MLPPQRLAVLPSADLSPQDRRSLAALWDYRAGSEAETAANYEALAQRIEAGDGGAGAAALAERVRAAASDERRHQELCARMAASYGSVATPADPPRLRRIAPHDLDGGVRITYEFVAFFCVTETINATLLQRSWEKAVDEATRELLRSLLRDEVVHSQLGWGHLAAETLGRAEVARRLPLMLNATTHDENFLVNPSPRPWPDTLTARGALSPTDLRAVFREAMEDVVLPGLDLCGIDTQEGRRWLKALTDRWRP